MIQSINMLLVDDDESIVRLLIREIRKAFHTRLALTAMSDPVAAKRWIKDNCPDLVLTDLQMPEVDGFEILRCAKRRNPYSQVIIHSGHSSTTALNEAIDLGVSDYVPKHPDPESLLQALEYAYSRVLRWRQMLPEIAVSPPLG